jgi:hypothetical protein
MADHQNQPNLRKRWTVPKHAPHHVKEQAGFPTTGKTFDFPVVEVGKSGPITCYYDPKLGDHGKFLAERLLHLAPSAYTRTAGYFRGTNGGPVNVIVGDLSKQQDGSGGAYHYGCDFSSGADIYLDAWYGDHGGKNGQGALGLFVAELSECFMGAQNRFWNCGYSNGEGLSRVMAMEETGGWNGVMEPFNTATEWDQSGRPNWIDHTEATDQSAASTGCSVLYIYWMISRGHSLQAITAAGGPTLANNYQKLTGKSTSAWKDFQDAIGKLPHGVSCDNPWAKDAPKEGAKQEGAFRTEEEKQESVKATDQAFDVPVGSSSVNHPGHALVDHGTNLDEPRQQ